MALARNREVARATFVSALLRSDPPAPDVSRQQSIIFAKTVLNTLDCCTRKQIQLCKSFIFRFILPSALRTAALSKFLLTISKTFAPRPPGWDSALRDEGNEPLDKGPDGTPYSAPFPEVKRLYILYIIHEVLSSAHYGNDHQGTSEHTFTARAGLPLASDLRQTAESVLKPHVPALFALAACRGEVNPKWTIRPLHKLVNTWKNKGLFSPEQIQSFTNTANASDNTTWTGTLAKLAADEKQKAEAERKAKEEAERWILPMHHGVRNDPNAPWHELPAGNGLYMKRTRGYPLEADAMPMGGYPLKNGGEEASDKLKADVTWLHKEVMHAFDKYVDADEVKDIDKLGNIVWKDPDRPTRDFWGFTYENMDKRKELARKFQESAIGYQDIVPPVQKSADQVEADVDGTRALATEPSFEMRGGRGGRGRGGWRGGTYRGGGGGGGYRGGRGGPPVY